MTFNYDKYKEEHIDIRIEIVEFRKTLEDMELRKRDGLLSTKLFKKYNWVNLKDLFK